MNARLDLAALLRASLAGFRHRLAFFILKKLVAFLLAGRANLLNDFGDSRREGRIDRRERFQRAAGGDGGGDLALPQAGGNGVGGANGDGRA